MRAQPAIVGKTLFLPVADANRLFAIDISGPPCIQWVYENDAPMRTSAAFGELPGSHRKVVVLGDLGARIHMVDAKTGERVWMQHVGLYPISLTTGTPVPSNWTGPMLRLDAALFVRRSPPLPSRLDYSDGVRQRSGSGLG